MTENSGSSAKPKGKAFSLKCSKLFLWLKLFGLMHVNLDGSEVARSSLGWIVYSYALICVTIAALIFTLLNIEVNFLNVKKKNIEQKFVIVFVIMIIFHVVETVYVVTSVFFSMKSNSKRLLPQIFNALHRIHSELILLKPGLQVRTSHAAKFWPVIAHLCLRAIFDGLTITGDSEKAFIRSQIFWFTFEIVTYLMYITLLLQNLLLITLLSALRTYFKVIGDLLLELRTSNPPTLIKWPKALAHLPLTISAISYAQEIETFYSASPEVWAHRVPRPSSPPVFSFHHCLLLYYSCLVTARRVNIMFNSFFLSSVALGFVAITVGCFFMSLFAILQLGGHMTQCEATPPIGLSVIHSFTLLFFLFRMVQCCTEARNSATRVLHCARQVAGECTDEAVLAQMRHLTEIVSDEELQFTAAKFFPVDYNTLINVVGTVVTYWIILIQLQVILLDL